MGEFWELTPRELAAAFEGAAWRMDLARKRDVALAWHVVAFDRSKRLPSLKRLLEPPKARKLSPEELEVRRREFEELKARMGAKRFAVNELRNE